MKRGDSTTVCQLKELLDAGHCVSFEQFFDYAEVTVYNRKSHAHYQGATLAEALNRALCQTKGAK